MTLTTLAQPTPLASISPTLAASHLSHFVAFKNTLMNVDMAPVRFYKMTT